MGSSSYAHNGQVSLRQIRRMLFLEIFGLGSLVLPGPLAKVCQSDGIWAILTAAGVWAMILLAAGSRGRDSRMVPGQKSGKSVQDREEHPLGITSAKGEFLAVGVLSRIEEKAKAVLQIMIFTAASAFLLYMITSLVERQLLDTNYLWLIVATVLFAGGYGILKGIECRARIYEILFWILMVPLVGILGIALWNVRWNYLLPVFASGFLCYLLGVGICMVAFLPAGLALLIRPACTHPVHVGRAAALTTLAAGGACAFVYLILVGIFQPGLLSVLKYPVLSLMSVVQMPGNLLERLDAPMVSIWFFCLFALFHSLSYYLVDGLRKLCPGGKHPGRKVWVGMIMILLTSLLLLLSGCGKKGPEENLYPLAMGIEQLRDTDQIQVGFAIPKVDGKDSIRLVTADSIFQAQESITKGSDKTLDLNHMKVMILHRNMLQDEAMKRQLFTYLVENENMAWNTCLFFTDTSMEELLGADATENVALGIYLEDLVKSRIDMSEKMMITVKDYMSLYRNQTETLLVPMLSLEEGQYVINEYCILSRGADRGVLSAREADLMKLLTGRQKSLSLLLYDDVYVTLQDVDVRRKIQALPKGTELVTAGEKRIATENQKILQTITLTGHLELSADWVFDRQEKEEILRETENSLERKMNRLLMVTGDKNHADLSNSYLLLQRKNWRLWRLYRDNPAAYEKKLHTKVQVELKLLGT